MISAYDIEQLVKPYLIEEHLHLFDVKVSGRAGRPLIQLFLDREDGDITVNAYAGIGRHIQDLLDMQNWSPGDYKLIVSSPGLDRPLSELWQFRKNIGRLIKFQASALSSLQVKELTVLHQILTPDATLDNDQHNDSILVSKPIQGRLTAVQDDGLIQIEINKVIIDFTLTQLSEVKVVIEFKRL
ncbi:MAG: hypothetical protein P9X24_01325 [Candidatus Hatepunaea meridiana]|nr:hypothetical protein [Candidatus Hatepunaea meridiana]